MPNLPGLSNNEKRYFLGIKNGKITYRPGHDAEPETYDFFEGELKNIVKREATINGATTLFYDFTMMNAGYTFVLSIPLSSSVSRSIILSLASIPNFNGARIKISPYAKDNYTNVNVYCNGERTKWVTDQIPPVKQINLGSKIVTDDSERIAMIESYVNAINDRLQRQFDPETGEASGPVVDVEETDIPEELG